MHKLMEYICDELEELERKADKEGKLSMAEIQYGDMLAHFKKNLLKADEMWEESEYSMAGGGDRYNYSRENRYSRDGQGGSGGGRGGSGGGNSREGGGGNYAYARGGRGRGANARRDSMGRYSREGGYSMDGDEMMEQLQELMQEAPDEQTRMEFQKFIQKIEKMQ